MHPVLDGYFCLDDVVMDAVPEVVLLRACKCGLEWVLRHPDDYLGLYMLSQCPQLSCLGSVAPLLQRLVASHTSVPSISLDFVAQEMAIERKPALPESLQRSASSSSLPEVLLCVELVHGRLLNDTTRLTRAVQGVIDMRPYPGASETPDWVSYLRTIRLVCTLVIDALSDFGRLVLREVDFPHEYYYLRYSVEVLLQQREVYLLSRVLLALRTFAGVSDHDHLLRSMRKFLVSVQSAQDGSWCSGNSFVSVAAMRGLAPLVFRGFGPWMPQHSTMSTSHTDTVQRDETYSTRTKRLVKRAEAASRRHANEVRGLAQAVKTRGNARVGKYAFVFPDGKVDERLAKLKVAMKAMVQHATTLEKQEAQRQEERRAAVVVKNDTVEGMRENLRSLARACVLTGALVRSALRNRVVGPALSALALNLSSYRKQLLGKAWRTLDGSETEADALFVAMDKMLKQAAELPVEESHLRSIPNLGRDLKALKKDVYSPPTLQDDACDCIEHWTKSMNELKQTKA